MILSRQIYFQKQGLLNHKCGLHALNNLLGQPFFTQSYLNQICTDLKSQYQSNYKHFLGGDYDANVLISALTNYNYNYNWLNNIKKQQYINNHLNDKLIGFIVNRNKKNNFLSNMLGFSDRHWIAVRRVDQMFYILDSKQTNKYPEAIIDFSKFIYSQMEKDSHIIEVFEKEEDEHQDNKQLQQQDDKKEVRSIIQEQ